MVLYTTKTLRLLDLSSTWPKRIARQASAGRRMLPSTLTSTQSAASDVKAPSLVSAVQNWFGVQQLGSHPWTSLHGRRVRFSVRVSSTRHAHTVQKLCCTCAERRRSRHLPGRRAHTRCSESCMCCPQVSTCTRPALPALRPCARSPSFSADKERFADCSAVD